MALSEQALLEKINKDSRLFILSWMGDPIWDLSAKDGLTPEEITAANQLAMLVSRNFKKELREKARRARRQTYGTGYRGYHPGIR